MKIYQRFFKRTIDILASASALLVLSVPLAVVTLWLHFANRGAGAFFRQDRPGKNGKIFRIVKFKTMTDERDAHGNLLPDGDRLTRVGRIVRSTSIDELPQLWNILKGDMSFIGPRPLLTWFLPLYDKKQIHRHDVKPGITGWAQVNGRNVVTYSHKFELDLWYVHNVSFHTDILILYKTIINVIKRKDVGIGIDDEYDDLGWGKRKEWAEKMFNNKFDGRFYNYD